MLYSIDPTDSVLFGQADVAGIIYHTDHVLAATELLNPAKDVFHTSDFPARNNKKVLYLTS